MIAVIAEVITAVSATLGVSLSIYDAVKEKKTVKNRIKSIMHSSKEWQNMVYIQLKHIFEISDEATVVQAYEELLKYNTFKNEDLSKTVYVKENYEIYYGSKNMVYMHDLQKDLVAYKKMYDFFRMQLEKTCQNNADMLWKDFLMELTRDFPRKENTFRKMELWNYIELLSEDIRKNFVKSGF